MPKLKKSQVTAPRTFTREMEVTQLNAIVRTRDKEIELLRRVVAVVSEHPPHWDSLGYNKYVAACNNLNTFYDKKITGAKDVAI